MPTTRGITDTKKYVFPFLRPSDADIAPGQQHRKDTPSTTFSIAPLLLRCLPETRFRLNSLSSPALNFRFNINSSASLLSLLALSSTNQHRFSRASEHLPFSTSAVDIRRDQLYPLVPPYLKILHPLIKIILGPPKSLKVGDDTVPSSLYLPQAIAWPLCVLPLPPLCGIIPIDGGLPIRLGPLRPFPYPVELGGEPTHLGLGIREGVPNRQRLVLLSLPHIFNLLDEASDRIVPGVALYKPHLSHHTHIPVDFPY